MLRSTLLGKRMRALSDNLDLAETAGIDTRRVILYTWIFAGGLAGLAGVLAGATTQLQPELGFELLLPIFAAVVIGRHRRRIRGARRRDRARRGDRMVDFVHRRALEDGDRVRGPDPRPDRPPTGDLRPGEVGVAHARGSRQPAGRGHPRGVHRHRLLDQRRDHRRHLHDRRARPAAQFRLYRDLKLRPGGVHGDRCLLDGDPRRRPRPIVLALAADLDPGHDRLRPASSACRRCACAPTTSRSRRSPWRRRSACSR